MNCPYKVSSAVLLPIHWQHTDIDRYNVFHESNEVFTINGKHIADLELNTNRIQQNYTTLQQLNNHQMDRQTSQMDR